MLLQYAELLAIADIDAVVAANDERAKGVVVVADVQPPAVVALVVTVAIDSN